jgi:hypothetical protein
MEPLFSVILTLVDKRPRAPNVTAETGLVAPCEREAPDLDERTGGINDFKRMNMPTAGDGNRRKRRGTPRAAKNPDHLDRPPGEEYVTETGSGIF